jgi:hypothetical protein
MKFMNFFSTLWVIFALLDPDPDSEYGSGSTDPIESGSNKDPYPQPCMILGLSKNKFEILPAWQCQLYSEEALEQILPDPSQRLAFVYPSSDCSVDFSALKSFSMPNEILLVLWIPIGLNAVSDPAK